MKMLTFFLMKNAKMMAAKTELQINNRPRHFTFMRSGLISLTSFMAICLLSCGPKPDGAKDTAPVSKAFETKPDRVARAKVAETALGEISRLERAFKPFSTSSEAKSVVATSAFADCKESKPTATALSKTVWKCGLDPAVRSRKEIEGEESINYDKSSRSLSYRSEFEIRNFVDAETREKAHTLITTRVARITFSPANDSAKILYRATASLKKQTIDTAIKGSDWSILIRGQMTKTGTTWTLDKDTVVEFSGTLFGLDGDRSTLFAAGRFNFQSEAPIKLQGLTTNDCTLPEGNWILNVSAAGETLQTKVATNSSGGVESTGGTFNWGPNHCDQP